jgi:uncharacterized protein
MNATPRAEIDRYQSLDITRGFALLGILIINIAVFAGPYEALDYPYIWGDVGRPLETWWVMMVFIEGTQRALFSILFGAGALLLLERLEAKETLRDSLQPADIYYRRIILLIGFGLFNAYVLLWSGDILFTYAIVALFLFPVRRFSNKALLGLSVAAMLYGLCGTALWYGEAVSDTEANAALIERQEAGETLSDADLEAIESYREDYGLPRIDDEEIQDRTEAFLGSYRETFVSNAATSFKTESTELFKWSFADVLSMMLIGMVLFRLGVLTLAVSTRWIVWMTLIGYGIGLPIRIWSIWIISEAEWMAPDSYVSYFVYDPSRLLVTLGHLGVILLFCRAPFGGWLKHALAAVGRTALTNYLAQSVICALIFTGTGLGLYGQLGGYQIFYTLVPIWSFQLIASPIWLKYFRYGPAEWLWRSLTYGRKLSLLR